jgi:hypothetical protein
MRINSAGSAGNAVVTALLAVLLFCMLIFGVWSFSKMQDYKNNTDAKISTAVDAAKKSQAAELQAQFDEDYKKPNKTYHGSPTYGSITFDYPKTWSAYMDDSSSNVLNSYFYPDIVPNIISGTAYALRVQLVNQAYNQIVHQYDGSIKTGAIKSVVYLPPKLKGVPNAQLGVRLNGNIGTGASQKNGSTVILQVRDKTLMVSTEAPNFLKDFDNTILATLSYSP